MSATITVVKPKVSYYLDEGSPIYSLPSGDYNTYAYWWGVNCTTLGMSEREAAVCREQFPPLTPEASLEFWLGFSSR